MRQFTVVIDVALIAVAVLVLTLTEAQTAPMHFLLNALILVAFVLSLVQLRKAGLMGFTPKQTVESFRTRAIRPPNFLTSAAPLFGIVTALIVKFH